MNRGKGKNKIRTFSSLLLGIALWFASAPPSIADALAAPAQQVDSLEVKNWVPLKSSSKNSPLALQITIMVNGKPVTKTVNVTDITAWVPFGKKNNETIAQYHERLEASRGKASQVKSDQIAAAINAAFADQFKTLGEKATVETYQKKDAYTQLTGTFGMVVIPGVAQKSDFSVKSDPTGEAGGGVEIRPGTMLPPGAQGSMGAVPGVTTVATGKDALGDPSIVDIGLDGKYVASITPKPGMTDEDVLMALESLLDQHGIPATLDASDDTLTLAQLIPNGETFAFGNSDTGLDFEESFGAAVPEPTSVGLFGLGLIAVSMLNRWRRRYVSIPPSDPQRKLSKGYRFDHEIARR